MKIRNFYVSNSSSSSFVCMLTLEAIELDYYDSPTDGGMNECVKCGSRFFESALKNFGFIVNPNDEGYIDSSECPVCLGRVVHKVLNEGETFKIIKNDCIEGGFC